MVKCMHSTPHSHTRLRMSFYKLACIFSHLSSETRCKAGVWREISPFHHPLPYMPIWSIVYIQLLYVTTSYSYISRPIIQSYKRESETLLNKSTLTPNVYILSSSFLPAVLCILQNTQPHWNIINVTHVIHNTRYNYTCIFGYLTKI